MRDEANRRKDADHVDYAVREVIKKYNKKELPPAVLERMKLGELREKYEELRQCPLGTKTMKQYDHFMNVQGFLKQKYNKPIENPIK